jgi:hypothetical protein
MKTMTDVRFQVLTAASMKFSLKLTNFNVTTRCYIPEDSELQNDGR